MTHSDYYARLAAIAMMNHGLNRDNHAALAQWAEYAATHRYTERGVLVSGDGRLHAETIHPPIDLGEPASWRNVRPPWQINPRTWRGPGNPPSPPNAIGDALDVIEAATGLPAAHIVYREVCTGWAGQADA